MKCQQVYYSLFLNTCINDDKSLTQVVTEVTVVSVIILPYVFLRLRQFSYICIQMGLCRPFHIYIIFN